MKLVLALALALALALPAEAHLANLPQGTIVNAGPYSVVFSPTPDNPYAGDTVGLTAQVSDNGTGFASRDASVDVTIIGPDGWNASRHLEDDGTGYLVSYVNPPAPGNYTLRADVTNLTDHRVYPVSANITVFPNLPFRIRSVDPNIDFTQGRTTQVAVETVDPVTLERKSAFDGMTVYVEHWTNDHKQMLSSVTFADVQPASPGLYKFDYLVPEPGMYHLRFTSDSGGFKADDVPLLHAIANPAAANAAKTPVTPVVALAALAFVALAWRRR